MVKPPLKRTATQMVDNPIYHGDNSSPFYEQVPPLSPKRLNSTSSQTNLDSPGHRAPSPATSTITTTSTHQLIRTISPSSPTSNNSFSWPYSAVQTTDAATFDAIEAEAENASRLAEAGQTLPPCTPGEESYMTMHSATNVKNVNVQNPLGQPRYAVDIHGNRYIEC